MSPRTARPLTTELGLLGFLRQEPMHGYEISLRLHAPGGPGMVWRMKQSHLYAVLDRLEEEGYIAGDLQTQPTRPARRVFHLTDVGLAAFRLWLETPVTQGRGMRQEFMVKLFFARQDGVRLARKLLGRQREVCRQWLELQRPRGSSTDRPTYADLVRGFRAGQIEAMLGWLDQCEERLPGLADPPRSAGGA